MDTRIEQLMEELFSLDPALKEHEKQVRSLLLELLKAKPHASIDADFAKGLRDRLLAIYPHAVIAQPASARWSSFFKPMMAYPLAGLAVLVLLVGIMRGDSPSSTLLKGGVATRSLGAEAFGPISAGSEDGRGGSPAIDEGNAPSQSQTAPAPSAESFSAKGIAPMAGGMGGGDSRIMPVPPDMTFYSYVYKGDTLDIPEAGDVYRRVPGTESGEIGSFLKGFSLGLVDASSFGNSKLQFLNIASEDYMLSVNVTEGSVSISENWKQGAQYDYRMLTQADMLPDADLIAIADDFIRAHGVSREGYGDPFVQKQNYYMGPVMPMGEGPADAAAAYVSDVQQVVYPLVLADEPVFDEGGTRSGLMVSVNLRTKKVNGVYNLYSQEYEVSKYPLENDISRIKKVLGQGGFRYGIPEGVRITELEVGEPSRGLVRIWNYTSEAGQELFVPALIFPVKDRPAGTYLPEQIVVPLVKSVLDSQPPQPVPYKGGVMMDAPVAEPRPVQ
jgi:hypothetical protein